MVAIFRVCASCEWIFKLTDYSECPKCGFTHYSARYVYGNSCYRLAKSQKPWMQKKSGEYEAKLKNEIGDGI